MENSMHILREITPLSEKDCFYIADRHKTDFTFPLHSHPEFELTYVEKTEGITSIVGDHVEEINDYYLMLITSPNLEHALTGTSTVKDVREITIQFSPDLFNDNWLNRKQFYSIKQMFEKAQCGITFPMSTIMKVYSLLDELASEKEQGFDVILKFMKLLYELSLCQEMKTLSTSSFAKIETQNHSQRILKVQKYIVEHYKEEIRLEVAASIVNMTPAAFCRFFKLRVGKTFSEYIISIRMGYATRELLDTANTISEISYNCGFNNLSNFNRLFKKLKGCTPKQFRELYKKKKIII